MPRDPQPDDAELRLPPASVPAEQSVIGGLLLDNDAIDRIGDLRADHFYRHDHRVIFAAILKIITAGERADLITVHEVMLAKLEREVPNALVYLTEISNSTPSAANIRRYAEIVRDRALKRSVITACDEITEKAFSGDGDARALLDAAGTKLEKLAEQRGASDPVRAGDDMPKHLEVVDARTQGLTRAIPTGFGDIDRRLNGGIRRGQVVVIAARPKMGKAQPLSSRILLADGTWTRMGDLVLGDALASIDGRSSFVTGVFPQGAIPTYRVTFSDGRSTVCSWDHLWQVSHRKWDEPRVMTLEKLHSLLRDRGLANRLYVPTVDGSFGSLEQLPVDPYLLGAMLGDGSFRGGTLRFSSVDGDVVARVAALLPEGIRLEPQKGCDYRLFGSRGKPNALKRAIDELGLGQLLSHEKFIPAQYLCAAASARIELLRGLMDTDGWVEAAGSCRFVTTSPRLAADIRDLARSLGAVVRSKLKRAPRYSHLGELRTGRDCYVLTIAIADRRMLFSLERKRTRVGKKLPRLAIVDVTPESDADECQCISVSHPSQLYVTDDYVVTHNTAFALGIACNVAVDHSALVLSMEMTRSELHDRNLASLGRVDLGNLLSARGLSDQEWPRVTNAFQAIDRLNLYLDDQGALRLLDVRMKARLVKRRHGLDLLVIDYLQLMEGQGDNRNAQIEGITRGLKALAKELDIGIVLLSQLNRKLEERENKRPTPGDLRDSGSIEQDADIVIFLYRDEVYHPDTPQPGVCEVNVCLNRSGEPGREALTYIGHQVRFESHAGAWQPPLSMAPRRARAAKQFEETA